MKTIILQGDVSHVLDNIDNFNDKIAEFDVIKQTTKDIWMLRTTHDRVPDFDIQIIQGFENDVCFVEYRIDISSKYLSSFSRLLIRILEQNIKDAESMIEVSHDDDGGISRVEIVSDLIY